jgi:hypothetical protein
VGELGTGSLEGFDVLELMCVVMQQVLKIDGMKGLGYEYGSERSLCIWEPDGLQWLILDECNHETYIEDIQDILNIT